MALINYTVGHRKGEGRVGRPPVNTTELAFDPSKYKRYQCRGHQFEQLRSAGYEFVYAAEGEANYRKQIAWHKIGKSVNPATRNLQYFNVKSGVAVKHEAVDAVEKLAHALAHSKKVPYEYISTDGRRLPTSIISGYTETFEITLDEALDYIFKAKKIVYEAMGITDNWTQPIGP